jgi:hypothetical protein
MTCRYARDLAHTCLDKFGAPVRPGTDCHYEALAQSRELAQARSLGAQGTTDAARMSAGTSWQAEPPQGSAPTLSTDVRGSRRLVDAVETPAVLPPGAAGNFSEAGR